VRHTGDFDRVSVPSSDADALRDWLLVHRAQVVIEIGLAYGASALAIAEALVTNGASDDCHLIIDPFQDQFNDAGWDLLMSAGLLDLCSLKRERSQLALARLAAESFVADAAFVDGSHIFHNVFVDLFFLDELVRPGGLVILDDCNWPSVATAANYFEKNAGWQLQPTLRETRLRSYRLPDPKVDPQFQDFQRFGLD
jgi:predicted O-methyltransferase YrrM